jgi:hypothetical protein
MAARKVEVERKRSRLRQHSEEEGVGGEKKNTEDESGRLLEVVCAVLPVICVMRNADA